ncbi:MAG: hypothetical protein OEZ33_08220, partial [Gammaproteobacteria bacterium]|nr:hypothetical protein [Gammaproteobacteria bacterium]
RIIDEKEARELFKKIADMQNKYDTDIGSYQKQVDSLRVTVDELRNNNYEDARKLSDEELNNIADGKNTKEQSGNGTSNINNDELNEDELYILKIISDSGGLMKDEDIVSSSKFDKVKTEFHLEDLDNKGYLSRSYNNRFRAYATGLTTISKKLMVEIGYVK